MDLHLASYVYAAARAEDLVVLDARQGEYLLLPGVAKDLAVAADSNRLTGATADLSTAFSELDLTDPAGALRARTPPPPPPITDLHARPESDLSLGDVARWSATMADMLGAYWRRPFADLVSGERRAATLCFDPGRVSAQALKFQRLLPWVPFQGECLFRSVMLRRYLRRAGLSATWVIGCRTWPFEAHCWLQVGDIVLDDTADHAASFTPLLAVGS